MTVAISLLALLVAAISLLISWKNRQDQRAKDELRWHVEVVGPRSSDADDPQWLVQIVNDGHRAVGFKGFTLCDWRGDRVEVDPIGNWTLGRLQDGDPPASLFFAVQDVWRATQATGGPVVVLVEDIAGRVERKELAVPDPPSFESVMRGAVSA